jgi:hypothetical protein
MERTRIIRYDAGVRHDRVGDADPVGVCDERALRVGA